MCRWTASALNLKGSTTVAPFGHFPRELEH